VRSRENRLESYGIVVNLSYKFVVIADVTRTKEQVQNTVILMKPIISF